MAVIRALLIAVLGLALPVASGAGPAGSPAQADCVGGACELCPIIAEVAKSALDGQIMCLA